MPSLYVPVTDPPANVVTCHALDLGGVNDFMPFFEGSSASGEEPPPQTVSSNAVGKQKSRNKMFLSDKDIK